MIFRAGMLSVVAAGLMLSPAAAGDESRVFKFDSVVRTEVTINRPAAEVWPTLVDLPSWKDCIGSLERVSGEPGAEGELKFMTPAGGTAEQGFFIQTVRLAPPRQFVIKVFPKDDSFFCFADFTLTEDEGVTHIIYDVYTEDRFEGFVPGDGRTKTRGLDSIQLVLDGERWRVVSLMTQYAGAESPVPARFEGGRE